jgi:hypothetical protein
MGGHLTDLKIWLFARSEDGKTIKNTCKQGCRKLLTARGAICYQKRAYFLKKGANKNERAVTCL